MSEKKKTIEVMAPGYELYDQVVTEGVPGVIVRRDFVQAKGPDVWLYYVVDLRRIEFPEGSKKMVWVRWSSARPYLERHIDRRAEPVEIVDRHVSQSKK